MYSTFDVDGSGCLACNNQVLGELGKIQGVYDADVDFVNQRVTVSHTDEVTREDILQVLGKMGLNDTKINCEL